jgi:formamidopyrimidine-DNA glycosylase
MPELPEVETTVRGLIPHVVGRRIRSIVLRRPDLRWPIPKEVRLLEGARVERIERRAKYILMHTDGGVAIWHLGMSGSLRVLAAGTPFKTHDHVDFALDDATLIRFHDPRRFGCLMYQPAGEGEPHPLLRELGPEPLSDLFSGARLFEACRGRKQPIKHFLMDQKNVVGVGNIYAAEALFRAGVRPSRVAGKVTRAESDGIVAAVKAILTQAIAQGGTTLRDFLSAEGEPGYFAQELFVYGRKGLPCRVCGGIIRAAKLGPRQSMYCAQCQR